MLASRNIVINILVAYPLVFGVVVGSICRNYFSFYENYSRLIFKVLCCFFLLCFLSASSCSLTVQFFFLGYKSCAELLKDGFTKNGVYQIQIQNQTEVIDVYCDQSSLGGGN